MRSPRAWLLSGLLLTGGAMAAFSLLHGQDTPKAPQSPIRPVTATTPAVASKLPPDLGKLPPLQQQMYLSVLASSDWLFRANRPDGRFIYGYLPAVNQPMEGDHYLRQVGAAFALARAAKFTGQEKYAVQATVAIVRMLADTQSDPADAQVRRPRLPHAAVNHLAAAGLLLLAIHELPDPKDDLLQQSDQLCQYVRKMQRPDGSLCTTDSPADPKSIDDAESINSCPGEALFGLMRSQQHRPAAWKTELLKKALAHYRPYWQKHKSMSLVPWQTAAFAEAYVQTGEQSFADFVTEMNDWLCTLQYGPDPRRAFWVGGFMDFADGKSVEAAPHASSASYAESLAEACRVARKAGDVTRYRRYSEALERSLQFLATLQYTEAGTQHFAAWYRPRLVGAYRASDHDGNVRIDYTQHALSATVQYLVHVARVP